MLLEGFRALQGSAEESRRGTLCEERKSVTLYIRWEVFMVVFIHWLSFMSYVYVK